MLSVSSSLMMFYRKLQLKENNRRFFDIFRGNFDLVLKNFSCISNTKKLNNNNTHAIVKAIDSSLRSEY